MQQGRDGRSPIQVMVPKLPGWDAISRYGRQIDANHWYSNFGPLVSRLELRLCEHFSAESGSVLTAANATLAISMGLMELVRPGTRCLMPSWTFAATPHAAMLAGLAPVFADVDPDSGALTPEIAEAFTARHGDVASVIVVSPFGQPLPIRDWETFQRRTGISVLVDAAASFDTAVVSELATVVSLHATKPLGCGEGGFILSSDRSFIERLLRRENFGFSGSRLAQVASMNAKMSEYHAAVALAALDEWPDTRAEYLSVSATYRRALAAHNWVALPTGWGEDWVGSTLPIRILAPFEPELFDATLSDLGIDVRRWWGSGCHTQPAFSEMMRDSLPVTDRLGAATVGVPFHRQLSVADIGRVVEGLDAALAASSHDGP
jgi:dTDP-4-amino-4,6-dideoxygalactose transaminase